MPTIEVVEHNTVRTLMLNTDNIHLVEDGNGHAIIHFIGGQPPLHVAGLYQNVAYTLAAVCGMSARVPG